MPETPIMGPRLRSGGNPQIAKGEGDGPVQAWIDAVPGWKSPLARRLDLLIGAEVPGLIKAVKRKSPLYGLEGQGWFLGMHALTNALKLAFFRGASLEPLPPGLSKSPDTRYLTIREADAFDAAQIADWVRQASRVPGVRL